MRYLFLFFFIIFFNSGCHNTNSLFNKECKEKRISDGESVCSQKFNSKEFLVRILILEATLNQNNQGEKNPAE
jgi:hypothetical protein